MGEKRLLDRTRLFFLVEDKIGFGFVLLGDTHIHIFVHAQAVVLQLIQLQSITLSTVWKRVNIDSQQYMYHEYIYISVYTYNEDESHCH